MKKRLAVCLSMILMGIYVLTGCDANYGDVVYECSSDNIWGFEGAYIDSENTLTIKFDTKHNASDNYGIGFGNVFESGEYDDFDKIVLLKEDYWAIFVKMEDVKIDTKNHTFSFTLEDMDVSEIKDIHIVNGLMYFDVDIVENTMIASVYEENRIDCTDYTQTYDPDRKAWSEVETISNF